MWGSNIPPEVGLLPRVKLYY